MALIISATEKTLLDACPFLCRHGTIGSSAPGLRRRCVLFLSSATHYG